MVRASLSHIMHVYMSYRGILLVYLIRQEGKKRGKTFFVHFLSGREKHRDIRRISLFLGAYVCMCP